jgi:hypothetical protein
MSIDVRRIDKTKWSKAAVIMLSLLPPLYIAYLVTRYGVNVPFMDQWELVPVLETAHKGILTISDLFAQHNEHRIFSPRLIMLSLAHFTKWNILFELYLNLALAAGTLFFILSMLKQTFGKDRYQWLLPLFSFLIFSLAQWENWTWGWQIQIYLNVLSFVAAVWAINRWPSQWKGLLAAALSSFVSSFSFSNGLLSWVVIAIIFLMRKGANIRHLMVWLTFFTTTVFFYFYGYISPGHHPSVLIPLKHPYNYIRYILAYVGASLGYGKRDISTGIGLILLAASSAATIIIRHSVKEKYMILLPWLALALYAILSATTTGVGRLGFGVGQALASRYTTISVLFIIASVVIMTVCKECFVANYRSLPVAVVMIISAFFVLFTLTFVLSFTHGKKDLINRSMELNEAALCLRDVDKAPDKCLKIVYPHPEIVRERAKALRDMKLSLYSNR